MLALPVKVSREKYGVSGLHVFKFLRAIVGIIYLVTTLALFSGLVSVLAHVAFITPRRPTPTSIPGLGVVDGF